MNRQMIRELFEKVPIVLLLAGYLGYLGWDYYTFESSATSALNQKKQEIIGVNSEIEALKAKIKKVSDFSRTLELKKAELRALAVELENAKGTLPEVPDPTEVMRTLFTEAKRSGLAMSSVGVGEVKRSESYGEQAVNFESKGVFFQYIAFLDRIANLNKIIRVEDITLTSEGSPTLKYIQLKSKIVFKSYHYIGTKADELGKGAVAADAGKMPTAPATAMPSERGGG